MQAMINLVTTRQKAGQPAELLRWYNDHVNILMRFEELAGATLYRCLSDGSAAAPEYACLYDFPSLTAFDAFEASDAKEHARQVTASGWGKQGIEIIQRTQYIAGGKWTGQASSSEPGFHIQCLDMKAPASSDASDLKRWLADTLYVAATQTGAGHYEWFTSGDPQQVTQQTLVLASAPATLEPAWHTWWDTAPAPSLGQAPDAVSVKWQAGYERVSAWRR